MCRKSKKKRSRSSSSSSSSSSKSNKDEDLPQEKSDSRDGDFSMVRLSQRESPGSAESGHPHGGFVSLIRSIIRSTVCIIMYILDYTYCSTIYYCVLVIFAHLSILSFPPIIASKNPWKELEQRKLSE